MTPLAATPTSTPEGTVTLTPIPGDLVILDQMELPVSSIETGHLLANEIHRWPHVITATKRLTVNLASELSLDLALRIQDAEGNVIAEQNKALAGEPEIIREVLLPEAGIYDILVSAPSAESGHYAILISHSDSYPFVFQGTLDFGESAAGTMPEENDHFWFFSGAAGQVVTIIVTPNDGSDIFLNLFGTDGVSLIRFHDEMAGGEAEQISSYTLPETGLYSLRIGEYNFGPSSYEVFISEG
jgi:hypothetical protein